MTENDKKLNKLLEDALDDLLDSDREDTEGASQPGPDIKESLRKISEVTSGSQASPVKHSNVKKDSKDPIKTPQEEHPALGEDEMNKFFENMISGLMTDLPKPDTNIDPEVAKANIEESVPQIFSLMQNLLSKELLYPALKDLSGKFDGWLEKNSPSLSEVDKKRYEGQRDIVNEIISVFDDELIEAQDRFEKNLDLMSKMQELGSPPQELTVSEGIDRCLQDSLNDKCSIM